MRNKKMSRWINRDTIMIKRYPEYFTITDETLDNLTITPEALDTLRYLMVEKSR